MFMVKCKYFADANITNYFNIRKFFAIFFKKNSPSPPHSLIFAIKARGSQQVNEPTSQQVEVRQVRQEMALMGPKTKHPQSLPPKKLVDLLTRCLVDFF